MLILGIAGSPRRNGNTEILLDEALASARQAGAEVEKIVLSTLNIAPAEAAATVKKGECIIKDDMQGIYEKIAAADAMIFASPNYFYHVSAYAKAAIDRSQALWARNHILKDPRFRQGKKGYFISVAATKGARLFKGSIWTMQYFFEAVGFKMAGRLLVRGVDGKGEILKEQQYLEAARKLGEEAAGK